MDPSSIDIWEHASLLYHAYEWHAAADAFATLFKSIESTEQQARCLFNSGIIQARLGDYVTAVFNLEEAVRIDQSSIVTLFALGLVCYELHDYSRAEYCFEICFDGLVHGSADYIDVGLDFVLDRSMLHNNLRGVRSVQFSASFFKNKSSTLVCLDAIPADSIFEAPSRPDSNPETDEQEPIQPTRIRRLFSRRRPGSIPPILSTAKRTHSYSPETPPKLQELESPLSNPFSPHQDGLSIIPEDSQAWVGSAVESPAMIPLRSPPPARSHNQQASLRRKPTTPFTPRDARGESDSTRELARFIRRAGQENLLIPRDARGEYESVEELSKFVQLYAPESSRPTTIQPLERDPRRIAELRLARLLSEEYDNRAVRSPTSESSLPEMNFLRRDGQYPRRTDSLPKEGSDDAVSGALLSPSCEPLSPGRSSNPYQPPLELLPQAVYKPEKCKARAQSDPEPTSASPEQLNSDSSTAPTSESSSNSFKGMHDIERKGLARNLTLRALEGHSDLRPAPLRVSQREKPLLPDPGVDLSASQCPTPSSVATEHFFEKVLGPGKARR